MGFEGDCIFWLLAVLAMTFVGLWSVWAGLGRAHWFVRMSVVLGWISLVVVIPAYELLVLFLVQAAVTIAILSAWRAWRVPARANEPPCGGPVRCRWQYSVRDLLLLTVLVAWLSAMLTRVPAQVWTDFSIGWQYWLLPAVIAGGLASAGAWIALSRRRWWVRLPVACLLFPSLLLIVWLMLAKAAGLVRVNATQSSRRRWASRAALALLSLLITLPLGAIYWRLATPLPIPRVALPNPNGYDTLIEAGKLLQSTNVPRVDTDSHAKLKDFVIRNDHLYDLIQMGLARPCRVPVVWSDPDGKWFSVAVDNFGHCRGLATALSIKAKDAEFDGRIDDAVAANLDTIRLGRACSRGGLLCDRLTSDCIEGIGLWGICELRKSLSKKQCVAIINVLTASTLQEAPTEDFLEREAIWNDNARGWMGRLIYTMRAITGEDDAMYRQISGSTDTLRQAVIRGRKRDSAKMRLLICDLAIRAYRLDHGRNPAKLADLVPEYLSGLPKDPFSGGQFVYRLTPKGYLLYSVGVNGVDDGGKQSSLAGLGDDGDILLDDPPSPPTTP
jgi:hypothetical protein